MKTKLFLLVENGCDNDDRGVSAVIGPEKSDIGKLHEEFRSIKEKTDDYPKPEHEMHVAETWATGSFATWLIKNKGFSQPEDAEVFYVDEYKEVEHIQEFEAIRNDPNTPKNLEEAKKKIENLKKAMKNPKVKPADNPGLLTKGWIVYDEDSDPEVCHYVQIPLDRLRGHIDTSEIQTDPN